MPVIHKIERKDGQHTAVWEITEDEETLLKIACLHASDLYAFSLLTNPGRRLEWLAARALLKELYPLPLTITYLENGKPLLANHPDKISISHSGNLVGIIVHPTLSPGIDIEMVNPRIFKIAPRFLTELEKVYLGANPSADQLTIIWGAKEVMFKVYGYGGVSFKNDFTVKDFNSPPKSSLEGVIYKDNILSIPMEYIKIGDFILVQTDYSTAAFGKNSDL